MVNSKIHYKGKRKSLRFFPILLLMLLYGVGCVEITSIHSLIHDQSDEVVLHRPTDEKDACHKSVYHNLKSEDCKHKAHLTVLKKCPLCQLSIQTLHISGKPAEEVETSQSSAIEAALVTLSWDCFSMLLPSRAPPVS